MESYLVDVNKLRIPRPKFASSNSQQSRCRPREPPRDYHLDEEYATPNTDHRTIKLQSETEDLRQSIQEKL